MTVRVYNAPDVSSIQIADVFKTSGSNRDRSFSPGYSHVRTSYLGTDALQLSEDAGSRQSINYANSAYSYGNFFKLVLIVLGIIGLMVGSVSALVVLGGIVSVIVIALLVLVSVFLYSINLNPFDKRTYKKVGSAITGY